MTPATPTTRSASAITVIPGESFRSTPSRVTSVSPACASLAAGPLSRFRSYACSSCPSQHHVVGRVHHVVDGRRPTASRRRLSQSGEGPICHAHHGAVNRPPSRNSILHEIARHTVNDRPVGGRGLRSAPEGRASELPRIDAPAPCHALVAEQIRTIGADIDLRRSSSIGYADRNDVPGAASGRSSGRMPSCSCPRPSSRAEQASLRSRRGFFAFRS